MNSFWTWGRGIFEDQRGSASSKRIGFYWAYLLITYMVIASVNGRAVNMEIFYAIFGLILIGFGVITSEFFKKKE